MKFWLVFIITLTCMIAIPGLLQMLWEEIKEQKRRKNDK